MQENNNCKNCQSVVAGNFCSTCGQSTNTHRLNSHFVVHDIQHGLLHFDKGVLYTIKELFTRPGHSIREYIEGKRVKHFKPISLVVLLATLYGLLTLYFKTSVVGGFEMGNDPKSTEIFQKIDEWASHHYVAYLLMTLPFVTLGSYLAFRKQRYNFIEHFVFAAFLLGQTLVLQLLFFPLTYFLAGSPFLKVLTSFLGIIAFGITVWANIQFFNRLSGVKAILLTLLSYVITTLFIAVFSVSGGFLYSFLFGHS